MTDSTQPMKRTDARPDAGVPRGVPQALRLTLGSDHAGVALKAALCEALRADGHDVLDVGPADATSVDYPDYAARVASEITGDRGGLGVLLCGTGIGMSIAANRHRGVRAALVHDETTARLAREHNDANILVLGARLLAVPLALDLVRLWLRTPFEARHQRRLDKLDAAPAAGGPKG